jgi:hypothetical protein
MHRSASDRHHVVTMALTVDIDLKDSRRAVSLLGRLHGYHAHIVHLEFPDGRWLVRARVPGTAGQSITDLLDELMTWHEPSTESLGVSLVSAGGRAALHEVLRGLQPSRRTRRQSPPRLRTSSPTGSSRARPAPAPPM